MYNVQGSDPGKSISKCLNPFLFRRKFQHMLDFKHMPKVKVKHMVKCFLEWRLS